jgi:predicted DNA-binding protein with PD1-like motif
MAQHSSATKTFALRLKPGADLKKSIEAFLVNHHIEAAGIVTCVGSLTDANIRFANQAEGTALKGHFEIVSLTGVLSINGSHLHLAISNEKGQTIGGHLLDGNLVYTTAELLITELSDLSFKREIDSTFGYKELVVEKKKD